MGRGGRDAETRAVAEAEARLRTDELDARREPRRRPRGPAEAERPERGKRRENAGERDRMVADDGRGRGHGRRRHGFAAHRQRAQRHRPRRGKRRQEGREQHDILRTGPRGRKRGRRAFSRVMGARSVLSACRTPPANGARVAGAAAGVATGVPATVAEACTAGTAPGAADDGTTLACVVPAAAEAAVVPVPAATDACVGPAATLA